MIQDIAPHKYYVDYQPSVPNDTDLVLIYGHHTILCNFEDPEICYPSIAEIAAVFPEIKEKAKFLFRIDETDYYEQNLEVQPIIYFCYHNDFYSFCNLDFIITFFKFNS